MVDKPIVLYMHVVGYCKCIVRALLCDFANTPTNFNLGQLSDFHYTVLAICNIIAVNMFLLSFQSFAKQVSILGAGGT